MSLVRAELRRLVKRRFVRWTFVLVLAVLAIVLAGIAATNEKHDPQTLQQARERAERAYERDQELLEEEITRCEEAQEQGGAEARNYPEDCQQISGFTPSVEQRMDRELPSTFDFRAQFPDMLTVFAGLLALFAFTVGASFVGAEWRSGGMMNLLVWRPRRRSVLSAKLAALLAPLTAAGVVLGAAWTGGFWLVAVFRGVTDTMTSGAWQSFGLAGLRGVGLVLAAGVIGFAVASLGRHTAAALGTAVAAFVVGVAGAGIVLSMLRVGYLEAYLWPTYVDAWLDGSVTVRDYTATCIPAPGGGPCTTPEIEIGWQVGGVGLAALVVLLIAAAMWQIRRRDVT